MVGQQLTSLVARATLPPEKQRKFLENRINVKGRDNRAADPSTKCTFVVDGSVKPGTVSLIIGCKYSYQRKGLERTRRPILRLLRREGREDYFLSGSQVAVP